MQETQEHDVSSLREALVETLKKDNHIRSPRVEAAFRDVPRHLFLPGVELEKVYSDEPIVTKRLDGLPISSSTQPAAMAIMLEQLDLQPGHRVLEIGAGTGYNAAVMAHLVGSAGQVVTVDIDADTADNARKNLASAGFERVRVICADGGWGCADSAPYDRIILTVGAWDIAPAWHEQLSPAGRLLLPLWIRGAQKTVAFERAEAHLSSVSISNCGFMRLRGQFAGPEALVQLGAEETVRAAVDDRSAVDADAAHKLLIGSSSRDFSTGVQISLRAIGERLLLWLALREPNFCGLSAEGEAARRSVVPCLFGTQDKSHGTYGLLEKDALCLLTRPPDEPAGTEPLEDPPPFELIVRSFGQGDALARRLIAQVVAWKDAGCPGGENLRIRAYPRDTGYAPSANEIVVNKQWMQFVFDGS